MLQIIINTVGVILVLGGIPLVALMIVFRVHLWWSDTGSERWGIRAKKILFGKRWEDW